MGIRGLAVALVSLLIVLGGCWFVLARFYYPRVKQKRERDEALKEKLENLAIELAEKIRTHFIGIKDTYKKMLSVDGKLDVLHLRKGLVGDRKYKIVIIYRLKTTEDDIEKFEASTRDHVKHCVMEFLKKYPDVSVRVQFILTDQE